LNQVEHGTFDKYYNLWILLGRAKDAIHRVREIELKQYNVSLEQTIILDVISDLANRATPTEIGSNAFRKTNTISVIAKRMEKRGLLKRQRSKKGKNSIILSFTEKGEQVYQQTRKREVIWNIFSKLSAEQIDQLHSILSILLSEATNELCNRKNEELRKVLSIPRIK